MSERVAVLFANDAFYVAFATQDVEAMDELWARNTPVSCIHPGWQALFGREDVMESWRAILGNPNAPKIECQNAEANLFADVAFVLCYESLDQGFLVATNIFVRESGAWKMIHHQAGVTTHVPDDSDREEDDTIQ